jgi:transglutaminase-like putative cysteine protease
MPDAAPHIEVLGFDCGACRKTHRLLVAAAERLGVPARIDKVSDPARIAALGALRVPGVAVNGRLVSQGGVPDARSIAAWLVTSPNAGAGS